MKVKTLVALSSEKTLDKRINEFLDYLAENQYEVIEIQYRPFSLGYSAMVIYNNQ